MQKKKTKLKYKLEYMSLWFFDKFSAFFCCGWKEYRAAVSMHKCTRKGDEGDFMWLNFWGVAGAGFCFVFVMKQKITKIKMKTDDWICFFYFAWKDRDMRQRPTKYVFINEKLNGKFFIQQTQVKCNGMMRCYASRHRLSSLSPELNHKSKNYILLIIGV